MLSPPRAALIVGTPEAYYWKRRVVFLLFVELLLLHVLAALGAEDIALIGEKATAHQTGVAAVATEAVRVPVAIIKRDELGSAQSGDGAGAAAALLSEELAEAVGAVGCVIT